VSVLCLLLISNQYLSFKPNSMPLAPAFIPAPAPAPVCALTAAAYMNPHYDSLTGFEL
jgi:hypothetical protein